MQQLICFLSLNLRLTVGCQPWFWRQVDSPSPILLSLPIKEKRKHKRRKPSEGNLYHVDSACSQIPSLSTG
jgi:hypothetical protein